MYIGMLLLELNFICLFVYLFICLSHFCLIDGNHILNMNVIGAVVVVW